MKIGAQFYTLREFCKTPEDLALSLRKVADIGYTTVQLSGTCEYDAAWMKEQLAANGLQCVVTHVPAAKLQENLKQVCDDHKVYGCPNVGLGMFSFNPKFDPLDARYEEFCRIHRPIAQTIKAEGLYFMYHNHNAEFRKLDGKPILDKMAEDFSADELGFILDTFWIQAGGANPAEYIRRYAGRIPVIHLKDYQFATGEVKNSICAIGDGNINFAAVAAAAADSGVDYMLVEQDDCHGEDPFSAMKRSYDYLKTMGLE